MNSQTTYPPRSILQSSQEYARGVIGGLIFSLPLLYTMEMWWAGFIKQPERLLLYIVATFLLLLGYNRYAGMRHDANMLEVAIDSVEEMGLGLIISASLLFLLGRITTEMALTEVMGKVVMEAMTVAIGVSVGTAQLGAQSDDEDDEGEESGCAGAREPRFAGQLTIAFCGAVLFAANVGPTEEIIQIGLESSSYHLLGMVALSLVLGALTLFGIEFRGAKEFTSRDADVTVLHGTVITYGVALIVSAAILWLFGRFEDSGWLPNLKQTIILALPAMLGASAGRLLLQAQ